MGDFNSDGSNKWLFVDLPAGPNDFDITSPVFRSIGGQSFNCALCNQPAYKNYSRLQMVNHCQHDSCHTAAMNDLLYRQGKIKADFLSWRLKFSLLEPRIEQLGARDWRVHDREDLFSRLISLTAEGNSQAMKSHMSDSEKLLLKYEHKERVSLLEMAVWKASCVMDKSEELTYYAMLDWKSRGWKESKDKMRSCNAIEVIVRSVLPFLS
jgi:hypothetical protein